MSDPEPTQEDFQPAFDRLSVERRVLGSVNDEDHAGLGPRNTVNTIGEFLDDDPYTDLTDSVQSYLDELEAAGLVTNDHGTYALTAEGIYELTH